MADPSKAKRFDDWISSDHGAGLFRGDVIEVETSPGQWERVVVNRDEGFTSTGGVFLFFDDDSYLHVESRQLTEGSIRWRLVTNG